MAGAGPAESVRPGDRPARTRCRTPTVTTRCATPTTRLRGRRRSSVSSPSGICAASRSTTVVPKTAAAWRQSRQAAGTEAAPPSAPVLRSAAGSGRDLLRWARPAARCPAASARAGTADRTTAIPTCLPQRGMRGAQIDAQQRRHRWRGHRIGQTGLQAHRFARQGKLQKQTPGRFLRESSVRIRPAAASTPRSG